MVKTRTLSLWAAMTITASVWAQGVQTSPATTQSSQPQFDARAVEVLKDTFKVYQSCKSYQDKAVLTVAKEVKGEKKTQSFNSQLVFERPNKMFFVWPSVSLICDGRQCQVYYPQWQQYVNRKAPAEITRVYLKKMLMEDFLTVVMNGLVSEQPYEETIQEIDRLEYEGLVEKNGTAYHKLGLIEGPDRVTMLIDRESGLIRELMILPVDPVRRTWDLTVHYKEVTLNQPVEEGKFKITEPVGARRVERISFTRQFDYPREGHKIPDFSVTVLDGGREASVTDFLGRKLTFVVFWATWCPPCRTELPILEELYRQYGERGVQMVGINLDTGDDTEAIRRMTQELDLSFPTLLDIRARYARELLVQNIPTLLILDSQGQIMEAHMGISPEVRNELTAIIEDALAKSPASAPAVENTK